MQRFLDLFISINCSTCFRRFLRPSSGVQNCTYSVRYCLILLLDASGSSITQYVTLFVQFCAPDDGRRNGLKHVEQFIEINRSRKRCILLVVLYRYYCNSLDFQYCSKNETTFNFHHQLIHLLIKTTFTVRI